MSEIKLELYNENGENATHTETKSTVEEVASSKSDLSLDALTEQEQKMVSDFISKIDISDSAMIMTYAGSSQNKIAQFADSVLTSVRTKDAGETGRLLSALVAELKSFDASDEQKKGIKGLFQSSKKSMDKLMAQYAKIEVNINAMSEKLDNHRKQLLKDICVYDQLYEHNLDYFKELSLYITAGKEKINEVRTKLLPQLEKTAQETNMPNDSQKVKDTLSFIDRFEKKLHDLQLSRTISMQMAPQLRLIQNNDAQLIDKIQSSIVNSIPLWKNQMTIALGLANSKSALTAIKSVSDTTNEMLLKNSEALRQGTIEVARENERSIVSVEVIRKTNDNLISTINEIFEIQKKGREDRQAAENEIVKIENDLKQVLLHNAEK